MWIMIKIMIKIRARHNSKPRVTGKARLTARSRPAAIKAGKTGMTAKMTTRKMIDTGSPDII
jgi:hypothetical protein